MIETIVPRVTLTWCGSYCTISANNFGAIEHATIPETELTKALEEMGNAIRGKFNTNNSFVHAWGIDGSVLEFKSMGGSVCLTLQQLKEVGTEIEGENGYHRHWPKSVLNMGWPGL